MTFLLSVIIAETPNPFKILQQSINRFNNQNISFICDIRLQSLSKEPINLNFKFHSYWPDSLNQYNYIKFYSPIDYKGTEIWSHYNSQILIKKRMPINNKIVIVENDSQNADLINFFNFVDIFNNIKNNNLSIDEIKLNNKIVYRVNSYENSSNKKTISFYIDKDNFSIYKVEWKNKRGFLNKILLFQDWAEIDNNNFPSKIIYEDIKKGLKTTCVLSDIIFDNLDEEKVDLIKVGFIIDD
tara:strand:+ start:1615 stop:2337 length:723 start_codon:yes stop_codon:yes gene_type:complete